MKFRNFRNGQIFRPKKLSKIFRITGGPEHDFANLIENEPNMNLTGGVKTINLQRFYKTLLTFSLRHFLAGQKKRQVSAIS